LASATEASSVFTFLLGWFPSCFDHDSLMPLFVLLKSQNLLAASFLQKMLVLWYNSSIFIPSYG
jgi:hypothetical protein